MSTIEEQVRGTLHEMADEARSAPLLQRLEEGRSAPPARRTTVLAAAAGLVAVLVLAASLAWVRSERGAIVEPSVKPPRVVRLSDAESAAPGRGSMLVVLADATTARRFLHEKPAYLLPVDGDAAVLIDESETLSTWTEHLSQDGTQVIRQTEGLHGSYDAKAAAPGLEIVDLRTGRVDDLHGAAGVCPALSPDNSAVAAYGEADTRVVDVATGRLTVIDRDRLSHVCGSLAWSPDSSHLVVPGPAGSRIVDRLGRTVNRLPGLRAVNASMSWSPDGSMILLYDQRHGGFVVRQVDGGSQTPLTTPAHAVKAMGWAGGRIVWLAGDVGEQRLVTTDQRGGDSRLWTRLETRGMAVESVSWATPLRGSARD